MEITSFLHHIVGAIFGPVWLYHIFREEVLNIKSVFWFSLQLKRSLFQEEFNELL